jgi:hypothetical protein
VFLTISTTGSGGRPATDLGFLLHKHPDKAQSFSTSYGDAHVFYPEASEQRCTAALLLEVDPVALVRRSRGKGRGGAPDSALAQYVNDRPYAASSLLAVALRTVFASALRGVCNALPERAAARLTGEHVDLRHRLGLLNRPLAEAQAEDAVEVAEWLALLGRLGLLPEGAGDEEAVVKAVHRFLARTPARMLGVWLPDAVGDRRPQNLPGTWDQYPNWRLPIADAEGRPVTVEQLAASPRLHALVEDVKAALAANARQAP